MATKVNDRSQRDRQRPGRPDLGPGHNTPSGDASDPRSENTAAGSSADPRGENTPSGDASDPRGELRDAEKQGGASGTSNGGEQSKSAYDPGEIGGLEQFSDDNSLYNAGSKQGRGGRKAKSFVKRNKKKILTGGVLGGGLAGAIIGAFFLLIPLKIEHIVENLQSHFFASSEKAIGDETENMLSKYIKRHVLPALTQCNGSTIDKNCNALLGTGSGPVHELYKGWRTSHLEYKLATKYNIEFKAVKSGGVTRYYMKAPGISNPNGDNITAFTGPNDNGDLFKQVSRGEARKSVRLAMENETKWKRVMYRFKVGRLLEEKYGIKRCIVFCDTRDAVQEFVNKKVNVPRVFLVQRVLIPRTETIGIVMECLLNPDCNPTQTTPQPANDGENGTLNGAPENPDVDTASRKKFVELAASYGHHDSATIEKMIGDYRTISEKGFSAFIIEKALEKAGLAAFSDRITNAIPIVGGILAAASVIDKLQHLGPAVKKLSYVANIGPAVQLYNFYRTYSSEVHTGGVDASQVGDMVESLGSGNQGETTDPEVGGTASAEDTPLYDNIINNSAGRPVKVALLDGILPAKASAAVQKSSAFKDYKCANGKPVPNNKLVCNEEEFGKGSALANSITDFFNQGFIGTIGDIAGFLNSVAGKIARALPFSGLISSIISHFPFVSDITDLVAKTISPLFEKLATAVIPNPFGSNMSGGRKVDLMMAGADGSGNDFGHTGIGGKKLTPAQVGEIRNSQRDESRQAFESQPFFARMFNTDSPYSLVTRLAMATPISLQASAQTGFASVMSNPLGALGHGFGSAFASGSVDAAAPPQDDPFGITQYGYTAADMPSDPETYWNNHCSDNASQAYQNDAEFANTGGGAGWNGEAADPSNVDPDNGMPTNTKVNACLLIKTSVGSAGALYDSSLLTHDDLADINGTGGAGGAATPATGTPPAAASGNAAQLAQQILASGNVDTSFSASIKADLQAAAAGKVGTAGVMTSEAILKLIATLAKNHKIALTAIQSNGQGHCNNTPKAGCPNDPHYTGDGVDFGSLDGVTVTGRNAPAITIIKQAFAILPSGSGIGQQQCGSTPALPSGWVTFNDACNHLHVQVPKGTP